MIGHLAASGFDLVEDGVDVLVDVLAGRKRLDVAVERVLRRRRRLPLVGPDDLPAGPLEPEPEPADPGEQLDDTGLGWGLLGHSRMLGVPGPTIKSASCSEPSRMA